MINARLGTARWRTFDLRAEMNLFWMRGTKLSTFVRKGRDARSSQADLPH